MDFGLQGKTALVLGASRGLGRAIGESLSQEGAQVAFAARNEAALAGIVDDIQARGARAMALGWDLGDLDAIDARVARVEQTLGPIDILINNSGGPPPTLAAGQPQSLWETQFKSMTLSLIAITDRILPGMRARKWGRIITCASSGVIAPIPNLAISNTLRAALAGWSKTLAREVAAEGVTVNMVLPGRIATDRIRELDEANAKRLDRTVEDVRKASIASIPAGRLGEPEEFAAVVAFLASTQAAYVTGSMIRVDGGMLANT